MQLPRLRSLVPIFIALALVLAACSDGDATDTTIGTSTTETSVRRTTPSTRRPRPTTTTSVAPPTTQSPPTTKGTTGSGGTPGSSGGVGGPIGVVGCSNTDQAVSGYLSLSSEDLLTFGDLGGGSVPNWGDPAQNRYSVYWGLYDTRRPAGGYTSTWVQLCLRTSEHLDAFDDDEKQWITHIVDQIHLRDPGIQIWISPINSYGGGQVCTTIGKDGTAIAADAADWAAGALPDVSRGPDLGPLTPDLVGVRDDCHPNEAGEKLLGSQLVAFFD